MVMTEARDDVYLIERDRKAVPSGSFRVAPNKVLVLTSYGGTGRRKGRGGEGKVRRVR